MIVVASLVAKLVDWRMSGRRLAPEAVTRYRVLRRTLFAAIVFVGVMSALLVIPQVRAIAGGVLASSAVVGLVIGFASQRVIGNAVSGILIALSQPLRIGDEVVVEGTRGVVEEIALTYTWIRTEVGVQVPATADLRGLLSTLRADADEAYLGDLADKATLVVRKWVPAGTRTEAAESDLRLLVADRLRAAGIIGG